MSRPRSQSNPNPRRPRSPYTYTPLPTPRHIRLIRLLHYDSPFEPPASPHPPSPDAVELLVVPAESFATFHRRDDLATTEGALLDTYTTDVRTLGAAVAGGNLSDFFRAYLGGGRFPERHLAPRRDDGRRLTFAQVSRLWIDAVCIDQGNAAEKAAQIPLMGEVYSRAGRVLAWLGAEEGRLEAFGWFHRVVYPAVRDFVVGCEDGRAKGMMRLREGNFVDGKFWSEVVGLKEVIGGSWARAWADYWAFYRTRRYFHRAWIVQEVVVAGRFELMAGSKGDELSWEDMMGFAFFLGHAGWLDVLDALAGEMLSSAHTSAMTRGFSVTDISAMQRQHQGEKYKEIGWVEHWWAALSGVRRRDCFVKQDKVFATVGILQQALPEGTPLPFPVDPAATPEEVYTHAATTLILNCPQLTLLSFVEHPFYRELKALPSWVPDLTNAKFAWPMGAFDTPFKACILPAASPPQRTVTSSGELHLRGFKLDTISLKTEYEPPMNIRLAEAVLQFLAALPVTYPYVKFAVEEGGEKVEGQFREPALVHTLTCQEASNINRGKPEETARLSVSFREWLLIALGQVYAACLLQQGDKEYSPEWLAECEGRREVIERVIGGLETKVLVPDVEELRAHGEAVAKAKRGEGPWPECVVSPQEFKDQIRRVMLYRCLFRTAEGWLGTCSQTSEVGDEVWLLEGGAVPYVLRPQKMEDGQERFMFCGECYVHGAMNGELVRQGGLEDRMQVVVIQ
ncbi:hypothetical protein NEMBOFW57_010745 [Staphylotrichum longicolle]|uniref:Heterokaryon incompatibility domain-containing protein n=1 Tax=Staphylotrichum longicolle TaxID=669026 RepID=A0AAD4HUI1_9PEZI|nr:hypothetical protein NEMBOFW57_010745 [Staphylotrichum longicolle]